MKKRYTLFTCLLISLVINPIIAQHSDHAWENHRINQVNEEPWRATFMPLSDVNQVFHRQRETEWYKLLNGKWRFKWSKDFDQRPVDFYKADYDVSSWDYIDVPCSWQMRGYGQPYYRNIGFLIEKQPPFVVPKDLDSRPVGSYVEHFAIPENWSGKNIYINFEGVESAYWFWINGKKVGYSEDSRTTSEFNITPYIKKGVNVLAVEVYRLSDGIYLEDQDGWRLSGIFRDVYLLAKPDQHFRDFFIKPELPDDLKTGTLNIEMALQNLGKTSKENHVEVSLFDGDMHLIRKEQTKVFKLKEGVQNAFFSATFEKPELWSNEFPNLYYAVMELKNKEGRVLDRAGSHFGFRKIEVKDRQIFVNGKSFLVKGVNRVEHDPQNGKHVREEMMMKDLLLIKQNNMNVIRTSHYPHDPKFYEWCDRLGIWVIDEANVESHGYGNNAGNKLAQDPEWEQVHLDRMEAMIQRDKNQPCVMMWSLGNEAGYGQNLISMHNFAHQLDPSRPTHYHAAERPTCCDVLGGFGRKNALKGEFAGANRYHSIPVLEKIASMEDERPFMLNEFAHAMGNSIGSLPEYVQTFEKHDALAGACVWDWVDQGLNAVNKDGITYWAYGGDFGDHSGDKNFCLNGIVFPDRSGKGKLTEVKHAFQNVAFHLKDKKNLVVELRNKFEVDDLHDYNLSWKMLENGVLIETGSVSDIQMKPGASRRIAIPASYSAMPGKEYNLILDIVTAKSQLWADAGFSVAAKSFGLSNWEYKSGFLDCESEMIVDDNNAKLIIKNDNFKIIFNKENGLLESYSYKQGKVLNQGPMPHFWRAPTDNDKNIRKQWEKAGLHQLEHRLKQFQSKRVSDRQVHVRILLESRSEDELPGFNVRMTYDVFASGEINVSQYAEPFGAMPAQLPRVGVQMKVNNNFNVFSWYGNGPYESYSDRKAGVMPGIWKGKVEDQWVDYPRPQENGNKTDVRWCSLDNGLNNGIKISSNQLLQTSVSYYETKNISEASHPYDLVKQPYVILNIDKENAALGNASCGLVPPLENYWIKPMPIELHFIISPLD